MHNWLEQYIQHSKVLLFGDKKTAAKIIESDDPKDQKSLGKQVAGFVKVVWESRAEELVLMGLQEKFSHNQNLSDYLRKTNKQYLVESSHDTTWGTGLPLSNEHCLNWDHYKGKNLLGKLLMRVREIICNDQLTPSQQPPAWKRTRLLDESFCLNEQHYRLRRVWILLTLWMGMSGTKWLARFISSYRTPEWEWQ